jgi:hypothetical protein
MSWWDQKWNNDERPCFDVATIVATFMLEGASRKIGLCGDAT